MSRMFGTDGVRGIANGKLDAVLAFRLGFAGAKVLAGDKSGAKGRILIGRDTRISGTMLESALAAGITAAGYDAMLAGVIPTPGIAYVTRTSGFDAGVMISASHNSFEYNGIKFFSRDGYKLPDATEDEIEKILSDFDSYYKDLPEGEGLGKVEEFPQAMKFYTDYLIRSLCPDAKGLKIVLDCANGASSDYASTVFGLTGAQLIMIGNSPDGININRDCGSTHLELLSETVVREGADMGFAFDGDADRFLACDDKGELLDGDMIMSALALSMKEQGKLKDDTLVVTVMSNLGVDIMAKDRGINLVKTKVGDRYVIEAMRSGGFCVGGEQSGHVILSEYSTTGDGMLTGLAFLDAIVRSGKTASVLCSCVRILPQVLIPARVADDSKQAAMEDEEVKELIARYSEELRDAGRILVRPSGTEPVIRVMIEGDDKDKIGTMAQDIADLIVNRFGN
ncbi:MAG: phosphoglucosamine mutase [Clostridiales bacterium]|nr:phosphoglucosamine mutase [Clostridiales bacterium]